MLDLKQTDRMLSKLKRFEEIIEPLIFDKVGEADNVKAFATTEQFHSIPNDSLFDSIEKGYQWGEESGYCWFKTEYIVPDELDGKDIFMRPHKMGYEAMLWVDGVPFGTFCTKIVFTGHGNHYCDLIKKNAKAGEKIDIAIEYYAGHSYKGCAPLDDNPLLDYDYKYEGFDICVKNYDVQDFYFDLRTANQLAENLPEDSFRRAAVVNALSDVFKTIYQSIDDVDREDFLAALEDAKPHLKKMLAVKNGEDAPKAGLIGHSHMDTAWLWHVGETIKKCARTYSNALALMEQYPEYKFIQSSSCHSDFIRRYYPELFKRIQQKVKEGRYEPNGGVWVECDCNITSGESMVRQFLWGQRFTRKYFDYTSNCFWLPDTFGYSAAIPQIMKGCGVDYFLTTKIDWNDTNTFPIDTFYWKGIDGTKVFTHFNRTHIWPDAEDLITYVAGSKDKKDVCIKDKRVTDKRIISYGYGDGGGGPQFEMIEAARRCGDVSGVPKSEHVLVGDYMKKIEAAAVEPDTYSGELYLELHRGTLTNQHIIKRNNRKAELKLRDLEIFTVGEAVKADKEALNADVQPLYETLLLNQFHDILPGTCIPRAHEESRAQTTELINKADSLIAELTEGDGSDALTLTNTLSFDRSDVTIIDYNGKIAEGGYPQQIYTDLDGNKKLLIAGVKIPAFSSVTLNMVDGEPQDDSKVTADMNGVSTPFAEIRFDDKGRIKSFVDKRANREICGDGYAFNTFLMAEDLPNAWDNWDIDADIEMKYADTSELVSSEIISCGAVAAIIRNKYKISKKSTITQDVFYFADSAEVRFDTLMDWQDNHRFLKTAFDTNVMQDFARFEVQFGNAQRTTTRNTSVEKAKFEVLNHKYTDLSETRFGVAILNDCKYGISVNGGQMRLSLHKGGLRPDFKGDRGQHRCVYSFLPHDCGFDTKSVIQPAYELNVPVVASEGKYDAKTLINVAQDNIIVETIKPCEDCERAFIVRMYEAEGTYTSSDVKFFDGAKSASITNMLEEELESIEDINNVTLSFRPFEIKTVKVTY
ncbi:MAG: alpha-mannosidase [Clostridia bacterium]|nr:alpha-mannosidase [Clostridia bacterium]